MAVRSPLAWGALVLLVAGCSSEGGGNNSSSSSAPATSQGGNEPEAPIDNLNNIAVPITPPSPSPVAGIPAAFQGRWGMTAADCNPARASDAKGLMTIADNRLTFYESRGTAGSIRQVAPSAIAFDLPMSGEGQQWSEPTRLTLQGDGRALIRQATGSPDRAGVFTYHRCPA